MNWPAFYRVHADGGFEATPATAGPWSAGLQHGGPPSALLARAMELEPSPVPQRLARITVEIMRPVPVGILSISTVLVRPGRKVALLEATGSVDGVECLRARGWRMEVPERPGPVLELPATIPALPEAAALVAWPDAYLDGYMSAVEWRAARGGLDEVGPAEVWTRPRIPLVEGEATSPLCRAAIVADSGSGISLSYDLREVLAINVDLTLTMWRDLVGDWVFMASRTVSGPAGSGLVETSLGDFDGIAGRASQTMLVAYR